MIVGMTCPAVFDHLLMILSRPFFRRVLALGFTLVATVMLVQSSTHPLLGPAAPPEPPDFKREILLTSGHIVVFCVIVLAWWWALLPNLPSGRALFVAVGFALLFGFITELAQSLVPDRQVSAFDLAVNWITASITAVSINRRQSSPEVAPHFAGKSR